MSKHTPGPWQAQRVDNQEWQIDAPDMLDALKLVVDTFENGGWPSATIVIAKAAIAKAEGNDAIT